jgi:hypothetical protein
MASIKQYRSLQVIMGHQRTSNKETTVKSEVLKAVAHEVYILFHFQSVTVWVYEHHTFAHLAT